MTSGGNKSCKNIRLFLYVFGILALTILLLLQVVQCIQKFLAQPTLVTTEVLRQQDNSFPVFTICSHEGYNPAALASHGIESKGHYDGSHSNFTWSSNQSGITENDLFELISEGFPEIVDKVQVRLIETLEETGQYLIDLDYTKEMRPYLLEQRTHIRGKCYSCRMNEIHLSHGVYYVKFRFKKDVNLYLHEDGQFLNLGGRMSYRVFLGQLVEHQVDIHEIRKLAKLDSGGNPSCKETDFDNCLYAALKSLMLDATKADIDGNCTAPWIVTEEPIKICRNPSLAKKAFDIYHKRHVNQRGDCPVPCHAQILTLSGKNILKYHANLSELYLFFSPKNLLSEEQLVYSFLSLMADIGGYSGLLLGLSTYNFLEWANVFLKRFTD